MCVFAGLKGKFVEFEGECVEEVRGDYVVYEGVNLFGGGLVVWKGVLAVCWNVWLGYMSVW